MRRLSINLWSYLAILVATNSHTFAARNDFDGDGRSDIGIYDDRTGSWEIHNSAGWNKFQFGFTGTLPVTGDFDGDGLCDAGVYEYAKGNWYLRKSTEGTVIIQFGYHGTLPVVADFDGDGKSDIATYEASAGRWYFLKSTEGFSEATLAGPVPVTGDFDGDGRDDFGTYDQASGAWRLQQSANGFAQVQFGFDGTVPAVGDFDGDGIDDLSCHRTPSYVNEAYWYFLNSTEGFKEAAKWNDFPVPTAPVVGDYDGNGVEDWGTYSRSNGRWGIALGPTSNMTYSLGYTEAYPIGASALTPEQVTPYPFSFDNTLWVVVDQRGRSWPLFFAGNGSASRSISLASSKLQWGSYEASGTQVTAYFPRSGAIPAMYLVANVDPSTMSIKGVYFQRGVPVLISGTRASTL